MLCEIRPGSQSAFCSTTMRRHDEHEEMEDNALTRCHRCLRSAAVGGKPHAAAMDVVDTLDNPASKGIERVRAASGRYFFKVKGSKEGDVYLTYNGYCSCMFVQKNADRDSFFKVSPAPAHPTNANAIATAH